MGRYCFFDCSMVPFYLQGLLQDLYVILLGAFTLYTLFVYIWKPINQNKKIRESDDE